MADEVELKLSLPSTQHGRLLRHPLLRQAGKPLRETLGNTYYDTPDLDLHQHGIALRVRRQDGRLLQTVKCAGTSGAGLSRRPEWETPYAGRFDFSAVDDAKLRRYLESPRVLPRLLPRFATDFQRTTWRFEPAPGAVLLVSLDKGEILAAGRAEPISELELELAGADASQLFDLALSLSAGSTLVPALASKAERGHRLASGAALRPLKVARPVPPVRESLRGLLRRLLLDGLENFLANREGYLAAADPDPEFVHQMRVACRRMKAALALFKPLLDEDIRAWRGFLAPLMRTLGALRDLDVLAGDLLAPVRADRSRDRGLAALVKAVDARREDAAALVTDILTAPELGRWLLAGLAWLHREGDEDAKSPSLAVFVDESLDRSRRRVRRAARGLSIDGPESLHPLRIQVKRLRYGLEFCGHLLRKSSRRQLAEALVKHQEALGFCNDLVQGRRLLEAAAASPAQVAAVSRVLAWHRERHQVLLQEARAAVAELADLKPLRLRRRLHE